MVQNLNSVQNNKVGWSIKSGGVPTSALFLLFLFINFLGDDNARGNMMSHKREVI